MTDPKCLLDRLPLLLLWLFLTSTAVVGQETFVKFYRQDNGSSADDAVLLSPDRLILVGRSFEAASGLAEARVLTLGGAGEVIRAEKLFLGPNRVAPCLSRQSDTTFSLGLSGYGGEVMGDFLQYRMSSESGQLSGLRWETSFEEVTVEDAVTLPGGDVVSVGSVRDSPFSIRGFVTRTRNDGTFVYQKLAGQPGGIRSSFSNVEVLADGSVLILGTSIGAELSTVVFKLDAGGTLLWERKYLSDEISDSQQKRFAVFPDGTFAFSLFSSRSNGLNRWPTTQVVWCDAVGVVLQSRLYGLANYLEFDQLLPRSNGNLLLVGRIVATNTNGPFALVLELNPAGAVLRQGTYRIENGILLKKIVPWLNGEGYYLIGTGNSCPLARVSTMILSVDKDFNPPETSCLESFDFTAVSEAGGTRLLEEAIMLGDVNFPSGSAPALEVFPVEARDQICLSLALTSGNRTDTFCYERPTDLRPPLQLTQNRDANIDSTIVALSGPGNGDYLFLPGSFGQFTDSNGTSSLRLRANGSAASDAIREAVSRLQFVNAGGSPVTGLRTVTITVYYDCGRTEVVAFSFYVYGQSSLTINLPADTVICPGEPLSLSAQAEGARTFRWSTGATSPTIAVTGAGDYSVAVSSRCRTDTFRVSVSLGEVPEMVDATEALFTCLGDSILFEPLVETGVNMKWRDDFPALNRTFYTSGIYQLVRSSACSEATTTVNVSVRSCCDTYLPNAFSPNGDGINDVFRVFPAATGCTDARDFKLQVYDRWGGEVYRGDGLVGWDGKTNGKGSHAAGVFVYVLEYFDGVVRQQQSGMLSLLR